MTREQAQIYIKLSREDLKNIRKGFDKHYDILVAFANGASIQFKYSKDFYEGVNNHWTESNDPEFDFDLEYRVKPSDAQTAEQWKPKKGETYFVVDEFGEVCEIEFNNYESNDSHIEFGNYFRTRAEAEAARERVLKALRNDDYIYIVKNVFVDYSERESSFDFDVFDNKKDAIEFFEKMIPDKLKEMELIQKSRELELEAFKYGEEELTWGCELRDKSDIVETASYTYLICVPRYPVKSETEE